MTQEQIEELKRLAEAATESPWDAVIQDGIGRMRIESEGCIIAEYIDASDAAFIAAARNAVPELIAEVDRITKQRDELLAAHAEMAQQVADLRQELRRYREREAVMGWNQS